MKVLGIDPGSTLIGYAIIDDDGSKPTPLSYGTLVIAEKNPSQKLVEVSRKLTELLTQHSPELVGVEKLYFSKNKKTALEVSQARGVILNTLLGKGLEVLEFTPNQVKQHITGYGTSDKLSVFKMVRHILNLPEEKLDDNASDALAIALTAGMLKRNTERLR